MRAIRLLYMLQDQVGQHVRAWQHKLGSSKLMYMDFKINGRATPVMVDTGAIHNFIVDFEARRLGLNLEKSLS